MNTINHDNIIAQAARQANVLPAKLVGPMPKNTQPLSNRPGLYLRVAPDTGTVVWSWWTGKNFCLYATSQDRALQRKRKRSKKSTLWFGLAQ